VTEKRTEPGLIEMLIQATVNKSFEPTLQGWTPSPTSGQPPDPVYSPGQSALIASNLVTPGTRGSSPCGAGVFGSGRTHVCNPGETPRTGCGRADVGPSRPGRVDA
jgi:hypothetical protein